jgi:sulfur carrier protein
MKITVNGSASDFPRGATVALAVRTLTTLSSGVAVAVNDEVVSRSAWETTLLCEGDRVEVLTAVQGG